MQFIIMVNTGTTLHARTVCHVKGVACEAVDPAFVCWEQGDVNSYAEGCWPGQEMLKELSKQDTTHTSHL